MLQNNSIGEVVVSVPFESSEVRMYYLVINLINALFETVLSVM